MQEDKYICDTEFIHREVIDRVQAVMPRTDDFNNLSNLYKMFADFTRIKILWVLSRETLCVCDLATLLGMTKSAISHQLRALRLTHLVKNKKQGKTVYYSLADSHVQDILNKGFEHINE